MVRRAVRSGRVSRRLTINSVLGLEDARRQARAGVLGQVARGSDPVLDRRKAGETDKNTLQAICERYIAREGRKTTDNRKAARNTAEAFVYPTLSSRQISDIKRSDINNLLRRHRRPARTGNGRSGARHIADDLQLARGTG